MHDKCAVVNANSYKYVQNKAYACYEVELNNYIFLACIFLFYQYYHAWVILLNVGEVSIFKA